MKPFKLFIAEAYTIFPTNEKSISSLDWPEENKAEVISLLNYLLKKHPKIKNPINIDDKKKSNVNISRQFQGIEDISSIKSGADLSRIKIKYGNGSSGNRGANNRGNAFEGVYATALNDWWAGTELSDSSILNSIKDLDKHYDLTSSKVFKVNVVGGENTRRPLQFSGRNITLTNTKGSGYDIGSSVTDITLTLDQGPIYLSLKLGGTTTFFNVGLKKILTKKDIENNNITSRDGKALLSMFGINEDKFNDIFNGNLDKGIVDTRPKYDKKALSNLLESGIGFGYHVIHKLGKRIISNKMDKAGMKSAAKITKPPTVYYGGKTGKGKRIDVEFESAHYVFKINIRDTQGKDGYPSRMMCDFKHK
jgi:hypothetical protein